MVTGIIIGAVVMNALYLAGLYWFSWRKQGAEFRGEQW